MAQLLFKELRLINKIEPNNVKIYALWLLTFGLFNIFLYLIFIEIEFKGIPIYQMLVRW